jgi:hypothetical protein
VIHVQELILTDQDLLLESNKNQYVNVSLEFLCLGLTEPWLNEPPELHGLCSFSGRMKETEENHRNYKITPTFKRGIVTKIPGFIPGGSGSIPGAGNFRIMNQEF